MKIEVTREELNTILEALIAYFKIRTLDFLPFFEKTDAREGIRNYYEKQQEIDEIATKIDNLLEILDEAENS